MTTATLSGELVARVTELRPLPAIALSLMQILRDPDVGAREVEAQLARDPVITARVLQLANSPFFGSSGQVKSIRDAIAIMGLRRIGTVTIAAATQHAMPGDTGGSMNLDAFWRHCALVATISAEIADARNVDPSSAGCAGLLHDIGRLALACLAPARMREVSEHRVAHDELPLLVERALLDCDHTEIGDALAAHWNLPVDIRTAIGRHHAPDPAAGVGLDSIVHVADALAHAMDISGDPMEYVPPIDETVWYALALDGRLVGRLIKVARRQLA